MKRTMAFMLMLMLCASLFGGVAEEAVAKETISYNWNEYEPLLSQADISGEFMEYEDIGFQVWIPDDMSQTELSEAQTESGIIDAYADSDKSCTIVVEYSHQGDDFTLETLMEAVSDQFEDSSLCVINDLDALALKRNSGDTITVIIPGQMGYFLQITYNGVSDKDFLTLAAFSIASIQSM